MIFYNYTMTVKPIARKIYIWVYKMPIFAIDKHMFVCYHVGDKGRTADFADDAAPDKQKGP